MNSERISKWDNIKFFMIASVVIGHTIYNFIGSSELAKSIYLFIYTYHMPVFVFMVGLFSKRTIREKRFDRVLEFIFTYLLMKFLDNIGFYLVGSKVKFHLFWEDGPGWFALAIAVFLLATMCLQNIDKRYVLLVAFFVGCVSGLDNHLGDHFASMRICVFYPIFLMGYYLEPKVLLMKDMKRIKRIAAGIISFLFVNLILLLSITKEEKLYPFIKFLKGKYPYEDMKYGVEGIFIRLLIYLLFILMIIAVISINIDRRLPITWLGSRTMSIFIWHNLIITIVFKKLGLKGFLKHNTPHYYLWIAICVALIITILSAYLPSFRISIKMLKQDSDDLYDSETGERIR